MNGKKIRVVSSRDPLSLPWKEEVRVTESDRCRVRADQGLVRAEGVQGSALQQVTAIHPARLLAAGDPSASGQSLATSIARQPQGSPPRARLRSEPFCRAPQNIDLVIEGTGVFLDRPGAGKHLQAGAKKVRRVDPGAPLASPACAPLASICVRPPGLICVRPPGLICVRPPGLICVRPPGLTRVRSAALSESEVSGCVALRRLERRLRAPPAAQGWWCHAVTHQRNDGAGRVPCVSVMVTC